MQHMQQDVTFTRPGPELLRQVRAGLILRGSNLSGWCEANNVSRQWVTDCLLGRRSGPAAAAVISRVTALCKEAA